MNAIESTLIGSIDELLRYTKKRMGDDDLAADTLQLSLLKALRASESLRDDDKVFPWFYRILDNTIKDIYRGKKRERKYMEEYAGEIEHAARHEEKNAICKCLLQLLPSLKPSYAEVIKALDLDEEAPEMVATRLGITRSNLKVRRHRARQQLRLRLEESCGICATHGCLDCMCKSDDGR